MSRVGTIEGQRPRRRTIGAVIALIAVLGTLLAPGAVSAQDDSPVLPSWLQRFDIPERVEIVSVGANGRVMFEAPLARVYGEPGDGFAAVAGGDMMNVCRDTKPDAAEGVRYRRNGQFVTTTKPGGVEVPTFVYKTELGIFEFFDEVCGGWFGNGIPIPAPFASGLLELRATDWNPTEPAVLSEAFPVGRYRNSVRGVVADVDGNTFDVFAIAGFRVAVENRDPQFCRTETTVTPTAG
jgi:hypothetical protein